MEESFNGWKNRETWAAALYIGNDQGLEEESREKLEAAFDKEIEDLEEGSSLEDRKEARAAGISEAADILEQWLETLLTRAGYETEFGSTWPAALADMASDIGSLYRIDYQEIAESILEDRLASFDREEVAA